MKYDFQPVNYKQKQNLVTPSGAPFIGNRHPHELLEKA